MLNKKVTYTTLSLAALLMMSGCASSQEMNNMYEQHTKKVVQDANTQKSLKSQIPEVQLKEQFVLTRNKTVSEALSELGSINGESYILKGADFQLPHINGYEKIKDFYSLKRYIEDTSDKTIEITNNKFIKDRIKTIRIVDKEAIGNELKNIKFSLSGAEMDLREALKRFSEKTGFSIVYNNKTNKDTRNVQTDKEFTTKIVSYQGVNAQQFIEYLRSSLNFYIDIDYVNKLCKIEKYRLKELPLLITNRTISKNGESGLSSTESQSSTSEGSSVQTKIEISVYDAFRKTVDELVNNINNKTGDENFVSIDDNTGIVSIFATAQAMDALEKKIKNFNKSYGVTGYATITIFELIVSNKYTVGSDLDFSGSNIFKNTTIGAQTNNISDKISSILSLTNSSSAGAKTLDAIVNSLNEIGYISKRTEYGAKFRNHVPSSLKELTVTNYVKNSTSQVTDGNTPTTSTSTETAEIIAGSETIVMPKIYGNDVSVYVSISDTIIESINKETFGTAEINIPTTKPRILDDEFIMRMGESQIVKNINTYENADNYKGIIPIQDFIIGGEKGTNFVRKELIYVLTISE